LNIKVKENFVCSHQAGTVVIQTGKLNSGAYETAQAAFLAHLALTQAPGHDIIQVIFLDWQHYPVVIPMNSSLHHQHLLSEVMDFLAEGSYRAAL
jgi:hypothetical protein